MLQIVPSLEAFQYSKHSSIAIVAAQVQKENQQNA